MVGVKYPQANIFDAISYLLGAVLFKFWNSFYF